MAARSTLPLLAALLALAGCSGEPEAEPDEETAAAPSLEALEIETATAQEVSGTPIGTVPGTVTLPPEARVAVASPFPGAAIRVFVIEGQPVRRGQPLALVRAAEPVQIGGELARAQAELGLAEARAERLRQLADEGIIAQARADEAQAQLAQAQASVTEGRRLAALAGTGRNGTMTLTSPIAGRVQHVGVETGGPVDGMSAPFVIEASGAYTIDLHLPERLARRVAPRMAIEAAIPAGEGTTTTASGRILSVAPSIEPETRSVLAKASIGAAAGLVAGQNVSVTISQAGGAPGVSVPARAVTRMDGADHVFVREGDGFVAREVVVAAQADGNAVVARGLAAGEVVAVSSVAELKAMNSDAGLAAHSH